MFSKACSIAREFTFPIIISQVNFKGECSSVIGSYVLINDEGWFVTAHHVIALVNSLQHSLGEYHDLATRRTKLEADENIKKHEKINQLKGPLKIPGEAVTNYSIWLGRDGLSIGTLFVLPEIDLAVGQLKNFDKATVKIYPHFKDPLKPMEQGTSLCKLGFSFHSIKPTYDGAKGFILPPGSVPIPFFPMEGIFTRKVEMKVPTASMHPLYFIETSSPGLRGQSGGPTFDVHGTVWAIQSQTRHLKLHFGVDKTDKDADLLKHQYLNVGWGIHSETLTSFFKEHSIQFQLSEY